MTNLNPLISVITPAFREEGNLPVLFESLDSFFSKAGYRWEWIVVDDHSSDRTFEVIRNLNKRAPHVVGLRFSRNYGSHRALYCGLERAQGQCVVALAADMQDPPEILQDLIEKWKTGSQVVWAARRRRLGESAISLAISRVFYLVMRNFVGLTSMPKAGADFFLVDARVQKAVVLHRDRNLSVFNLLCWLGYRSEVVFYDKQKRLHGVSGWTLKKKVKLFLDSVFMYTSKPLKILSVVGFLFCSISTLLFLGLFGFWNFGVSPEFVLICAAGAMLFLVGAQALMSGVMGEYIWRGLDEGRDRPLYTLEDEVGFSHERSE